MANASQPRLIPGTFNARHLGGLSAGGDQTLAGALIRSDAPIRLGDAGRAALQDLGVRTAIDLRHPIEVEQDPADLAGLGIEIVNLAVIEDLAAHSGLSLEALYDSILHGSGPALARAAQRIADADPEDGPVLIFCSAGKDRTGILTALLLATAGVDADAIVADYHRTEDNMQGEFRAQLERRARSSGLADQELAVKFGAPESLMRDTLARVSADHGSAAAYLCHHGLAPRGQAALERRFLGDRS